MIRYHIIHFFTYYTFYTVLYHYSHLSYCKLINIESIIIHCTCTTHCTHRIFILLWCCGVVVCTVRYDTVPAQNRTVPPYCTSISSAQGLRASTDALPTYNILCPFVSGRTRSSGTAIATDAPANRNIHP